MEQNKTLEHNGLEYTVRKDGDVKITNPDTQNTLYLAREELGHFLMELEDLEKTEPEDEVLLLDEEDELYGYAIYNAHKGCFAPIGEFNERPKSFNTEENVVSSREEAVDAFEGVVEREGLEDYSHLRVVAVRLDNELDRKAVENLEGDE